MAIFEIINDPFYNTSESIPVLLNYITQDSKCFYSDCYNLFESQDILILTNQFLYIKNYYQKTTGTQLHHFVLSLDSTDEEVDVTLNTLAAIADSISDSIFGEYQTVYGIHNDTPVYHIHFVINSINLYTGHHFRLNKSNFHIFIKSITDILRFRNIALQGFSYYDDLDHFHHGKHNGLTLYGKTMNKYKYY